MMFASSLTCVGVALASCLVVSAQANIPVTIGARGLLVFEPNTVVASPNDTVVFTFAARHAVAEGTFETPCARKPGGFDSEARTPGTNYTVAVKNLSTIWIHCDLPGHCPTGMVFAINPPTSGNMTYPIYKARAQGLLNSTNTATATSSLPTTVLTGTLTSHPGSGTHITSPTTTTTTTTTSTKSGAHKQYPGAISPLAAVSAIFVIAATIGLTPTASFIFV